MQNRGLGGRIILILMLKVLDETMWTGLFWLTCVLVNVLMEIRIPQNSENFFITQEPLTSKYALYSLKLFIRADVNWKMQKQPAADKTFMHRPAPLN